MDIVALKSNWALWLALVPVVLVTLIILKSLRSRSSGGQLRAALKNQNLAKNELRKAKEDAKNASRKLEQLSQRAQTVKPRALEEARGALEDARALEKILDDKYQVNTNHLRRVIFEEFPPSRHEKLRQKHLPQDVEDGRPFSF